MRVLPISIVLITVAGQLAADHRKPQFDPETREGFIIQQIQQERDPAEKLTLLNDFVFEFRKSPSAVWAYEELQSAYLDAKEYDKVIAITPELLDRDPQDFDAAGRCLTAAEALNNTDQIKKCARESWIAASLVVRTEPKPAARTLEAAHRAMQYAEYALTNRASQEPDARKRQEWIGIVESLNPKSPYLAGHSEFYNLNDQGVSRERLVAAAERGLEKSPDNEDMLLTVAEYHSERGDNPDRVLACASRILAVLPNKPRPEGMSPAEWTAKKEKYLTAAHWMGGIVLSMQGRYADADRNLRQALPLLKANDQVLGATLYHLGYANYQLAESGERQRIFEALKFNQQCAAIPSTYRDQAQKNIESIKSEYNLR